MGLKTRQRYVFTRTAPYHSAKKPAIETARRSRSCPKMLIFLALALRPLPNAAASATIPGALASNVSCWDEGDSTADIGPHQLRGRPGRQHATSRSRSLRRLLDTGKTAAGAQRFWSKTVTSCAR